MANEQQLAKLREGAEAWNAWREANPEVRPSLSGAILRESNLRKANLSHAYLWKADLCVAELHGADLSGASLSNADVSGAVVSSANLAGADLTGVNLSGADFRAANIRASDLNGATIIGANLAGANLEQANLAFAALVRVNLAGAKLDGSRVYGTSVWDVHLDAQTSQNDLVITPSNSDEITVDDLEIAQFIYLMLENRRVRQVIDTITSKVVLILGRFTGERKKLLNALRDELRKRNYTPVLFDFEKPDSRDLTETITILASMARFVIADISAAKSVPQELSHIIPNLPSVPIQPLLLASDREYAMFEHWRRYPWVLPDFLYKDEAHLLESLSDKVIEPAERKRQEQTET